MNRNSEDRRHHPNSSIEQVSDEDSAEITIPYLVAHFDAPYSYSEGLMNLYQSFSQLFYPGHLLSNSCESFNSTSGEMNLTATY